MRDFFISYSSPDMIWADWIAWELDSAGFEVFLQRWDFAPGTNFVHEMQRGVQECHRLILVLSHASIASRYVDAEWSVFFAADPTGKDRRLVPVRIDDCTPPGLLAQINYIDLHKTTEQVARSRLISGLKPDRKRPISRPTFPGIVEAVISSAPPFPLDEHAKSSPSHTHTPPSALLKGRGKLPSIRRRQQGRAFATQQLPEFLKHMAEDGRHLSVIALDVDGMTGLNARFGISIGDTVIERLLFFCEQTVGRFLVARTGDDTLLLVLREQDLQEATETARALVSSIASHDWDSIAADLFVHCSAGVAEIHGSDDPFESILKAQYALRAARKLGGNRVASEGDLSEEYVQMARLNSRYRSLPDT